MATQFDANRHHAPTANNLAVVQLAAPGTEQRNIIWRIDYSYSNTPTNGFLFIRDGTTTVFELDITAAGPGSVVFANGQAGDFNNDITVTLTAGGATIYGKLNVEATVE